MSLPFTIDQFLTVFGDYNRSFWAIALVLWLASAALLVAAWRRPARWSVALSALLAAQWLWSGLAYHALLFTRINPAAWAFAAFFVLQSALLLWKGRTVSYFTRPGAGNAIGLALACYALAYPILSVMRHHYPAAPTFGVPCPTAVLTIGVLLTTRGSAGLGLAVIPALWGLVGGSAALLLAIPLDSVLLGAGVLMTITLIAGRSGLGNERRVH